jgi:hypothetical protein
MRRRLETSKGKTRKLPVWRQETDWSTLVYGEGRLPLPLPPLGMPRDKELRPRTGLPAGLTAEPLSEEKPLQKNFLPETKGSATPTADFGGPPRVPFLRPRTAFASVLKKLNRPWSVKCTPSLPKTGLRAASFSVVVGGMVPTQPSVSVTQNQPLQSRSSESS